jgi:hypothetical protein
MPRLQIPACRNHSISNRAPANFAAFLINLWTTLRMNRSIRARSLVQFPMRSRHYRVRILLRYIARNQTKLRSSDFRFKRHRAIAKSNFQVALLTLRAAKSNYTLPYAF